MLDKSKITSFLRKSLQFQEPNLAKDPAYKYTNDDLWDIFTFCISGHNPFYTIDSLPENELYFVILMAKKEIYYRLATASAPFYPLTAEGASLRKDYRFEHYMSLIRRVEQDYTQAWERFLLSGGTVDVTNLVTKRNHFSRDNYNNAITPTAELRVDRLTESLVELSWNKFKVLAGVFWKYELYLSRHLVFDDYAIKEEQISKRFIKKVVIQDIHKVKYRFTDLKPHADYIIALLSYDTNGLAGVSQLPIKTLNNMPTPPTVK